MNFAPTRPMFLALAATVAFACSACTADVALEEDDQDPSTASATPEEDGEDGEGPAAEASTGAGEPTSAATGGSGEGGAAGEGGSGEGGSGEGGSGEGGSGEGGSGEGGSGEGGAPPVSEVCAVTAQILMTDVGLDVAAWQPGESAMLSVTLTSPVDHFNYPGVRVSTDVPGITPELQENALFGLLAGEPTALPTLVEASPFVAPGTVVTFRIEVFSLGEECEGTAETTFQVTLQ